MLLCLTCVYIGSPKNQLESRATTVFQKSQVFLSQGASKTKEAHEGYVWCRVQIRAHIEVEQTHSEMRCETQVSQR